MSNPHVGLDPDPLVDPLRRAELEGEWFDRGYAAAVTDHERWRKLGLVLAASAGLLFGIVLTSLVWTAYTNAAPRSAAQLAIPASAETVTSGTEAAPLLGAPLGVSPSAGPNLVPPAGPAAGDSSGAPPITEPAAIAHGTATWCAPTPTHCQSWGGDAHLGAMQSFTFGDQPYQVTVTYRDRAGAHSTVLTVVSFCACPDTLIDLSVAAFEDLAPRSLGRIQVTVTDAAGVDVTPPATSTETEP